MDMSTTYMGLKLKSPVVPSASPLSHRLDNVRKMEDGGAGAIVLWSLFEEQIEHDANELEFYLEYGTERFAESLTYFPAVHEYKMQSEEYLEHIGKVKRAVDIPVIASLNGISPRGWTSYAQKMQQAGADALELNVYFIPTDPKVTSQRVEDLYISILKEVKGSVQIPVAMKLSPYFASMPNFASQLVANGADALVLFNRFFQPDIDVVNLDVVPSHVLSTSADNHLTARWIALLYGRVQTSLAATNGVHTPQDVAKMILAGADVAMTCSALLKNGVGYLATLCEGLAAIMEEKGYDTIQEMRGALSQRNCPEPAAFERANYMKSLTRFGGWGVATLE